MTNVDSQRIKEIRDNTRAMAEAFGRIADALADALELYISTQTETQNSNLTFKTLEYCDICDHKGCEECIANALDEHCMPSQFNKQIEDECAKKYEELGLKELNKTDRHINKIMIQEELVMEMDVGNGWSVTDVWWDHDIPPAQVDCIKVKFEKVEEDKNEDH